MLILLCSSNEMMTDQSLQTLTKFMTNILDNEQILRDVPIAQEETRPSSVIGGIRVLSSASCSSTSNQDVSLTYEFP